MSDKIDFIITIGPELLDFETTRKALRDEGKGAELWQLPHAAHQLRGLSRAEGGSRATENARRNPVPTAVFHADLSPSEVEVSADLKLSHAAESVISQKGDPIAVIVDSKGRCHD
jgi:hypothetical protein